MSSYETSSRTEQGWPLSSREWSVIGGASALMAINVLLMYVVAVTPLVVVNEYLFAYPIVGVLAYGAAITAGNVVAERGVEGGDTGIAFVGLVILQLAFGIFGAGILSVAPRAQQATILGVTAIVTAILTAAIATYVYARSTDFEHWGTYANYSFVAGVVAILIGTFFEPVLLAGFALVFLGFLLRLGWQIWRVRDRRAESVALQTIGVYVAVAGVFVHVLQLAMRALARR